MLTRKEVGERIRFARETRNVSINKLAEKAGITPGYLSHAELGKRNISLEILGKIADALEVPPQYLISNDKDTDKLSLAINEIDKACLKAKEILLS